MPEATRLGLEPLVHPTAHVRNSRLGDYVEIGPHCSLSETVMGDYSCVTQGGIMWHAEIEKLCSIAAHSRINAPSHLTWRAARHHFTYRSVAYGMATPTTRSSSNGGERIPA